MLENSTVANNTYAGLDWTDKQTMTWDEALSVSRYHLYFDDYGMCLDDLLTSPTATLMTDPETPLPGEGFFYEVSHDSALDGESSLGMGRCAERSNYRSCP